jgi:hypothetical protein
LGIKIAQERQVRQEWRALKRSLGSDIQAPLSEAAQAVFDDVLPPRWPWWKRAWEAFIQTFHEALRKGGRDKSL